MHEQHPTPARYSIPQFAELTGLSRSTVYERIARGLIKLTKDGRRSFVSRAELERYLKACEQA